jgi:hypothetical protein
MSRIVKMFARLWLWTWGLFEKGKPVMSLTDEWLALGHRLYEKGKATGLIGALL